MVIKRRYTEIPTLETRSESNESVDRQRRYHQIVRVLKQYGRGMTAKEIAVSMCNIGYIPTSERNFTAPRLTELSMMGVVEPLGKTICQYTGKKVTVYGLRSENE